MKCPACGHDVKAGKTHCPFCGQEMPDRRGARSRRVSRIVMLISWMAMIPLGMLVFYKVYFWADTYNFDRLYTRGAYAPTVSEITMDDGRAAHAVTFYGTDGDRLYIEELKRTVEFSGGVARVEIADSDWFGSDIEQIESAEVSLAATLIYESGDKRNLPEVYFEVTAPESPIQVISPAQDDISVNTSIYLLEVQVVPGSTVNVNGRDVTDIVDRSGLLSVNVNVFPIGDNTYSIIVNTPNHKEARRDVLIYRQEMEIAVEISSNVPSFTNSETVTISGACDLGATISVDTDYVEDSLRYDPATGEYSFMAKMTTIGINTVRFRASMDGKADSVLTLEIDYLPGFEDYADLAWSMDYRSLCAMFEEWEGRVFKCDGMVKDVFMVDDVQYLIMDVGTEGTEQLVVLENYSKVEEPVVGTKYTAFADVNGRYMYKGNYHPRLKARYMYE